MPAYARCVKVVPAALPGVEGGDRWTDNRDFASQRSCGENLELAIAFRKNEVRRNLRNSYQKSCLGKQVQSFLYKRTLLLSCHSQSTTSARETNFQCNRANRCFGDYIFSWIGLRLNLLTFLLITGHHEDTPVTCFWRLRYRCSKRRSGDDTYRRRCQRISAQRNIPKSTAQRNDSRLSQGLRRQGNRSLTLSVT